MAQRTLHYLLGRELLKEHIQEPDRFLLGCILPDSVAQPAQRIQSHYVHILPDRSNYFDFEAFYQQFAPQLAQDELYIGYYLHLVSDACYRQFLRSTGTHALLLHPKDIGRLHKDYRLVDHYLTEKYHPHSSLTLPADFDRLELCQVARFDPEGALSGLAQDLSREEPGYTSFFTEDLADAFLLEALPLCRRALAAVRGEGERLSPGDFLYPPAG